MSILVTGGAGFIGSHTVETLLARGDKVIALDNFNTYYSPDRKRRNVAPFLENPNFRLVEGDVRDRDLLERLFAEAEADLGEPVKHVAHIAAMAGVRFSITDPVLYQQVNVAGTQHLVEVAIKHEVEHFVYASSSSVYGNTGVPYREDARTDTPLSPYAATKKMSEVLLYTYHHIYKVPVTNLRFFTVYGPRGRPDMAVYLFTDWIARDQPVRLFGDGSQGRDYTYVTDTVSGVIAALDRPNGYQIYNLGNNSPQSNAHLIEIIEQHLGKKAHIEYHDYPSLDPQQTCADITRARADLGYSPQVPLEEGVRRFVEWYRSDE
ncbi:MAG TPA: GDP-mannose 4,6-dehydratase [Chloroflexia bacterium]|jgi:UDP-glucuronate 4-epimerase